MKYCLFANYVKDVGFYENLHVVKENKNDYVLGSIRAIKMTKDVNILKNIVGKDLYYIGEFDDVTGKIVPGVEKVLNFDEILPKEEKEVS